MIVTIEELNLASHEGDTDERLSEKEAPGWMFRKGEIVWMWVGNAEALDNMVDIIESPEWAAGVVCERPTEIPVFHTRLLHQDQVSASSTYTIELCQEGKPGTRYEGVQQHFLLPWLARKEFLQAPGAGSLRTEHPSLAHARKVVETCSLIDEDTSIRAPDMPEMKVFNGMYLGAEKIFVGDPIRVLSPTRGEDVLVVMRIFLLPDGDTVDILLAGILYSSRQWPGRTELTHEQFQELPLRMRLTWDPPKGGVPIWARVNNPDEWAQFSAMEVLGRWYEYHAVQEWRQQELDEPFLGVAEISRRVHNRAAAVGWTKFNRVAVPMDGRKPSKSVLTTDDDDDPTTPSAPKPATTSKRTWGKSRMAMAVADDEDEDEDEDEEMEDEDEDEDDEDEEMNTPPRKKMALGSSH
jgi:hypothetical protein